MENIGPYQIIKRIATGGMGEVFLAYDPICKRNVALKRIKEEYKDNQTIKARFLKEAKIAGQLTHPNIIPIYSISYNPLYYTMTYVEGETLKQILNRLKENENESSNPSIAQCIRYFFNVCEAIAYTHSKKILHRDLKPDNIMIGKYGEVLILDWGIACFLDEVKQENLHELDTFNEKADLTRPGKLAGTICYMAPERATGSCASILTDIYALGALLYQILTLFAPFKRHNMAEFKKLAPIEKPLEPIEKAPFRDIPLQLNEITKKCLSFDPKDRYQNVDELIADLKNYLEGKPDWILKAKLNISNHADWQFQENIFLAKYLAIDQTAEETEWVSVMYSKKRFSENIKLETDLTLKSKSMGIGFLLCVPEDTERKSIEESYCIWINHHKIKLLKSNLLLKKINHNITMNDSVHVKIEKADNIISCYLNDQLILSHISHLPLLGQHVGIAYKDDKFTISEITIYSNTYNALVSCLAIPDAFFAKKRYDKALAEYREIASSFGGRTEGRQALFRAGLTLISKANGKKTILYEALDEFAKLHNTQSEPLEYLGKALTYSALKDSEEELKCLELAARKFSKHPLFPIVEEHIIYRMHESALNNREITYRLALIALTQLKDTIKNHDVSVLTSSIRQNLAFLYFIDESNDINLTLAIKLAFLLNKKTTLLELMSFHPNMQKSILFSLLELNYYEDVKNLVKEEESIKLALLAHEKSPNVALQQFFSSTTQPNTAFWYIMETALIAEDFSSLTDATNRMNKTLNQQEQTMLDLILIKQHLLQNNLSAAEKIFKNYSKEITQDNSPFYFPYGCFSFMSTGKYDFFEQNINLSPPSIFSLGCFYLMNKKNNSCRQEVNKSSLLKNGVFKNEFYFEKKELFKQLFLFYHCTQDTKKKKHFQKLIYKNNHEQ